MNWQLGLVVHDITGWPWVYIGHRVTVIPTIERIFVRAKSHNGIAPERLPSETWEYRAVKRETLIMKFPDLAKLWPLEQAV